MFHSASKDASVPSSKIFRKIHFGIFFRSSCYTVTKKESFSIVLANLEKIVSEFLRDSLAQRYSICNIRRYPGFNALSDAQIEALRIFGLEYIYPEWESHCFQRRAFKSLTALLAQPMRLQPLVAVALHSLFQFGSQLPRAVEAGKDMVNAFEAVQELEQRLVSLLHEVSPDNARTELSEMHTIISLVPREAYQSFVNNMVALMQLLADRALLDTGHNMLQNISAAMDKRADRYTEIEREGMRYALQVMEEGLALFAELDDAVVEEAIAAIPQIELDWYDSIAKQAG